MRFAVVPTNEITLQIFKHLLFICVFPHFMKTKASRFYWRSK
ncbi:hypothetical protein LEP1GSC170_0818 [Leptospira interrogans serovar Bataviae str. HAI135]|nr:hypothetical protein LEP1GSC170_0818 [Leptospira interrogans serovar Bataviae str. HAI135]